MRSLFVLGALLQSSVFYVDGLLCSGDSKSPQPYLRPPLLVSDIEEIGWEMVFRATSGNDDNVYDAWTTGLGVTTVKPLDMRRSYARHFRDENVAFWTSLGVRYVKVGLYKMSEEVGYVVFNGTESDSASWFAENRVLASSWSDLSNQHTFNIFSIRGLKTGVSRSFYISTAHGGCDGDQGQLAIIEHTGSCDWDEHRSYPQIIYSDMNGDDVWNRLQFGRADYLAVFVNTGQQPISDKRDTRV